VATFDDGTTHEITDMTIAKYKALKDGRKLPTGAGILMTVERKLTKNKVTVAQRVDRTLLMSVYEQKRQIAQVRIDVFGPLPRQGDCTHVVPNDDPTILKCLKFLRPMVLAYADGTHKEATDLKAAVQQALKDVKKEMEGQGEQQEGSRATAPRKPTAKAKGKVEVTPNANSDDANAKGSGAEEPNTKKRKTEPKEADEDDGSSDSEDSSSNSSDSSDEVSEAGTSSSSCGDSNISLSSNSNSCNSSRFEAVARDPPQKRAAAAAAAATSE
jgi:hypothetical protein